MPLDLTRWTGKGRILEIIEQDLANALHALAAAEQTIIEKDRLIADLVKRVNATAVTDGQAAHAAEPPAPVSDPPAEPVPEPPAP